jgi:hypothetical protein
MTLGRKDFSVTRTDGGANVFRLGGFLRDDDLIGHNGSFRRIDSTMATRTYSEHNGLASCLRLRRPFSQKVSSRLQQPGREKSLVARPRGMKGNSRKLSKRVLQNDISEFESFQPRQAV